jgi:FkbM family methyltransferase
MNMFRLFYKYSIAGINTLVLFSRSFVFLSFRNWMQFWMPGIYIAGDITIDSRKFSFRANHLLERVADLYMIMTCVLDKQYTPAGITIKEDATIIDIGGHIGSFSVFAASQAPKGHVYTFEPDPANYTLLQKNIRNNELQNVIPAPLAVSATSGMRHFYSGSINSAESGLYKKSMGAKQISVRTISLEDLFRQNNISYCDFLKIDCEGAEYEIVFSAPPELLNRISTIAMECHNPRYFTIPNPHYSIDGMKQFLQKNGFSVQEVKENAMHSLLFAQRANHETGI